MNPTSALPRPLPSRQRLFLFRRLRCAFLGVCALIAAANTQADAEYSFTLIADSQSGFGQFNFSSTSLNAAGTVAFIASSNNGSLGVFTGNGGSVTTIASTAQPGNTFGYPSINDAGTVAFFAQLGSGNEERIVAGSGGPLVTIADAAGPFSHFATGYTASTNAAGTVAFWAAQDSGPAGIFGGNGGATAPLFLNSPPLFAEPSVSLNDAGRIAFRKSNGTGIVTVNGGSITTIVDSSGPLNYFGSAASLNEAGTVAFVAGVGGVDGGTFGVYTGNGGPLTTIADISGPFSSFGTFNTNLPSLNDSGTVAFFAGLDVGGSGLYVGDGVQTQEVIGTGDALFGSTISALSISPTSFNNAGQVAFYYRLADGTTGIAVASPVPEPSSALLLALCLGLGAARCRGRGRR